ncbi:MAG: helix-turn-helix transcriptional regulator [Chitinophagales bacterium]|nr:helix-turn-helix transcriptional regulator [Chitinophagales bacterium]
MSSNIQKFYEEIGASIKKARTDASVSQDTLGGILDLTRTSIVNIESGRQRPSIFMLMHIAKFLNVNFCDLVPELSLASDDDISVEIKAKDIQTTSQFDSLTQQSLTNFLTSINDI